jgi:hypothetical protein
MLPNFGCYLALKTSSWRCTIRRVAIFADSGWEGMRDERGFFVHTAGGDAMTALSIENRQVKEEKENNDLIRILNMLF